MTDPAAFKTLSAHKHGAQLTNCRFDPAGERVYAGGQDFAVVRLDLATGEMTSLVAHDSWPWAYAFSPFEPLLATGGYDGKLVWWPIDESKPVPIRVLEAHDGWIRSIALSPDATRLASVGNDGFARLWSVRDGSLLREWRAHESHVYSVAFHPNGHDLVTGDLKATLRHWEAPTGKLVREIDAAKKLHIYDNSFRADYGGVRDLAFSADGSKLAAAGLVENSNAFAGVNEPGVVVLDWAEPGSSPLLHRANDALKGTAWNVRFHPDGYILALSGGQGGGGVLFWRPGEERPFHTAKLPNSARGMDLHIPSNKIATAHIDSHIRIHEIPAKTA